MSQSALNERTAKLDHYLQNQMRKTGNQVRMIDLFTCCMKLFAGMLAALFLLALIDGWLVELNGVARWGALILLLFGGLAYTILAIVPLLIRKINPVYAAKVVESAQPDMKNSLINYLLLRRQPGTVSRRVVEIVGSKAANDISGLPVENTVDKSHTIKAALILTALVMALGAYKVFSPKDPFQTFARILAPASDISKPARVSISDVSPGNTEIFFGQQLEVTAFITGKFDEDSARVVFSSLDGQIADGSIRMEKQDRNLYRCTLKTGEKGIEQSLRYKVVAGDGVSSEYTVKMTSTPILTVEAIHYRPAEYMELSAYTEAGVTTIKHYEGTEVTIDAVANADIRSCYMQLLREEGGNYIPVTKMSMEKIDDRHATGKIRLQLNSTRDGQSYTHYQLHLITNDAGRNRSVAANRIIVDPDLAPTIFVDDPQDTELEVPVNSRLRFVVQAQDIDFKLHGVSVAVENETRRLKELDLEIGEQNLAQPVSITYEFWPNKLYLNAGDTAALKFAAFDNRIAPDGKHRPNMTLSNQFTIKITEPIENPPKESKPEEKQPGESVESGEKDENKSGEKSDESNGESSSTNSGEADDSGEKSGGENQQDGGAGAEGEESQSGEGSQAKSGESGTGSDSNSTDQPESGTEQGSESTEEGSKDSQASKKGDKGDEGQDSQAGTQSGESGGSDTSENATESGESGSDSSEPGKSGSDQSSSKRSGDQSADDSAESQDDGLSEDAHDRDIFEEVNKFREQQEKQNGQDDEADPNKDSGSEEKDGTGEGENESPDDKENQDGSKQDGSPEGSPNGSEKQTGEQSEKDGDPTGKSAQNSDQQSSDSQTGDQGDKSSDPNSMGEKGDEKRPDDSSQKEDGNEKGDEQPSDDSGDSKEKGDEAGQQSGDKPSDSGEKDNQDQKDSGSQGEPKENQDNQDQKQDGSGNEQKDKQDGSGDQADSKSGQSADSDQPGKSGDGDSGEKGDKSDSSNSEESGEPGDSGSQGSKSDKGQPQGKQGESSSETGEDGSEKSNEDPSEGGSESGNDQKGEQKGGGDESESTGEQPGGKSGGGDSKSGDKQMQGEGEQSGKSGKQGDKEGQQSPDEQSGGNNPGAGASSNSSSSKGGGQDTPEGPGSKADEANLEYTKKATDMTLEYLEDQVIDPDPKLLDRMNWSDEDLADFVKRWKELKKQAASGDAEKQREYEQALKSLGMGDRQAETREFQGKTDDQEGYREDGRVNGPPPGFADRMKAWSKKRNRVRDDE